MKNTLLQFVLLAVVAAGAPAETLSEDDAVRRALAGSLTLQASRLGVSSASNSAASILRSPELRFAAYDDAADTNLADLRRTNVGLRWTPPRLSELGLPAAQARARADQAAADLGAAENRVAAEIRLLHRTVRLMDEQIRIADENVRTHQQIVDVVAEQAAAGVRTALDRSRAELELAGVRAAAARFRSERRIQMLRLCQKIGISASESLDLTGSEGLLGFQFAADRLQAARAAAGFRREIAAAVAGVRLADLRLSAARRERYPWVSFVQFTRQEDRSQATARWGFQVGIDLGVFRWRTRETKGASVELRLAQLREQAARSAVTAEVEEIAMRLESAARELAGSAAEIEALARRQVDLANAQLASGESDRTEPLAAQVRLIAARHSWLAKLMECHALAIGLDQASGRSVPTP